MSKTTNRLAMDRDRGEIWPALWELLGAFVPDLRRIAYSAGITVPQLVALKACQRGPRSGSELAHQCDRTAPAITFVTRDLETMGLLRRTPSDVDRRRVEFSLTPQGRAILRRIDLDGARWERELARSFSSSELRSSAKSIALLAARIPPRRAGVLRPPRRERAERAS